MADKKPKKFYKQHKLPRTGWTKGHELVQRFIIIAEGSVKEDSVNEGGVNEDKILKSLKFNIYKFDAKDPVEGVKVDSYKDWEKLAEVMLDRSGIADQRGSLDFGIYGRSRVLIFLPQTFWYFSSEMPALSTKQEHQGRYYDLRLHTLISDGGKSALVSETQKEWLKNRPTAKCKCISFATEFPHPANSKIKHGYCFNIELEESYIPITVDPDIENKGGGG